MKMLVVSHACVNPINQQFFADVQEITGWEITILTPESWGGEYGDTLTPSIWPTYKGSLVSLPVVKSGNIPLHFYKSFLTGLLKDLDPDFIYVNHDPYAASTIQVYIANALSIRKPIGFFSWQNINKKYPFPFSLLERWVFGKSHCAFPGSVGASKVLRDKGFTAKLEVLPGSVDASIYHPDPESKQLRNQLDVSPETILLGYLGRLVPEKGLATLLESLALIKDLDWRFAVVGAGAYQSTLEKMAQKLAILDRVSFLGYIPHVEAPKYLSVFDALVIPSETQPNWKEQFGRVIIEAMACGTPVIGSDSGEIPNLIRATGGGLVFSEKNVDDLANQLRQIILNGDLRQQLADAGKLTVLNNYSSHFIAQKFVDMVESCVSL